MATLEEIQTELDSIDSLVLQLVQAEEDADTVSPQQPVIDQTAAHVHEIFQSIQAAVTNEKARAQAIAATGVGQDVNPTGPGGLGAAGLGSETGPGSDVVGTVANANGNTTSGLASDEGTDDLGNAPGVLQAPVVAPVSDPGVANTQPDPVVVDAGGDAVDGGLVNELPPVEDQPVAEPEPALPVGDALVDPTDTTVDGGAGV